MHSFIKVWWNSPLFIKTSKDTKRKFVEYKCIWRIRKEKKKKYLKGGQWLHVYKNFYSIFLLFLFLRTGSLNFHRPHLCACVYEKKKKMSRTFVVIFTRNIFLSLLSPCCVPHLLPILIHISSFHISCIFYSLHFIYHSR